LTNGENQIINQSLDDHLALLVVERCIFGCGIFSIKILAIKEKYIYAESAVKNGT